MEIPPEDGTTGDRSHCQLCLGRAVDQVAPPLILDTPVHRNLGKPCPAAGTLHIENGKEGRFPVCRLISRRGVRCPVIVIRVLLPLQVPRHLQILHHVKVYVALKLRSAGSDALDDRIIRRQVRRGTGSFLCSNGSPVSADGARPLEPRMPVPSQSARIPRIFSNREEL